MKLIKVKCGDATSIDRAYVNNEIKKFNSKMFPYNSKDKSVNVDMLAESIAGHIGDRGQKSNIVGHIVNSSSGGKIKDNYDDIMNALY
jgi:hypothetical protein